MSALRMPAARSVALAWGAGAFGVISGVASGAFAVANWASFHDLTDISPPSAVVPLGFGVVGALVASRQPRNATGWLFIFVAIVAGVQGISGGYALIALVSHPGAPGGVWALWLYSWIVTLVFPAGALTFLLLLFPDGHLPSPRWKPVAIAAVIVTLVLTLPTGVFAPGPLVTTITRATPHNPLGLPATGTVATVVSALDGLWLVGFALFVIAAAAPLVRMRRSQGDERQQLKWIAWAVLLTAALYIPAVTASFFDRAFPILVSDVTISVGFGLAVPVAAGIAIFKHRLYDIDVVISRTLVYGTLALLITAVYIGIAVGVGAAIGGGGKPNLGLSIVATGIVAIGFQPARQWLQKLANRLVYGARATPYEVLSQFAGRVAESYAVDEVLPRMAQVLAEGTGAQRADVWLRNGAVLRSAASWPLDAGVNETVALSNGAVPALVNADRVVEVRQQNELLGALSVSKRGRESLTPIEEKLLSDLAHQAGLVLKNVGLTTELQARLNQLRSSRQRIVAAQDSERRRIERDLHDGAQQHLVALKVKLGLVEMLAERDPEQAKSALTDLKHDADQALETLRDLARGIYPPLLAVKGLAAALRSQAAKATLPVHIDADGVGRYPRETESALYFCTLEGLQNVQKYAAASAVAVRLRESGGQLSVEISDDGRGFDVRTAARGAGLTNMEDRIEAIGGTLQIESTIGTGTTLRASVPVSLEVTPSVSAALS